MTKQTPSVSQNPIVSPDRDYISALNDDELLTILCLLDTVDVMQASLVCRRWASLALQPAVWQKRTLDDGQHTVSRVGLCMKVSNGHESRSTRHGLTITMPILDLLDL